MRLTAEPEIDLRPLPCSRLGHEDELPCWLAHSSSYPAFADEMIVTERPTRAPDGLALIGSHAERGASSAAAPILQKTARGRRSVLAADSEGHSFLRRGR